MDEAAGILKDGGGKSTAVTAYILGKTADETS